MSTINPPVELEDPDKQSRLEYIQNIATQADFDYPQVNTLLASWFVYFSRWQCAVSDNDVKQLSMNR